MTIEYKSNGAYDYYGLRSDRLADTELFKGKAQTFYEYDTSKVYVSTGTGWREWQDRVANKIVVSPLAEVLVDNKVLAAGTVIGSYTIQLVDATGVSVGDVVKMNENGVNAKTFHAVILSITTNTLTIDRPIDKVFTVAGTNFKAVNPEANVNGSVTPVVFENANPFNQNMRINRVLLNMVTTNPTLFNSFGDIAGGLTKGIEFRKRNADGSYTNYWNAKSNNRLALLMFDVLFFDATNPQAVNGLSGRFTFTKLGSFVELKQGEALELLVQDDLSSLLSFEVVTEGTLEQG